MLQIGWIVLAIEFFLSILLSWIFWHFWTHSAMRRPVAVRAIIIYALGCAICLALTFFLPL